MGTACPEARTGCKLAANQLLAFGFVCVCSVSALARIVLKDGGVVFWKICIVILMLDFIKRAIQFGPQELRNWWRRK